VNRLAFDPLGPEYFPLLSSMLRDTANHTSAAQAAHYFRTAIECQGRGNVGEAEAHLWKAMEAYKLAKENAKEENIGRGDSEKFLPCLEHSGATRRIRASGQS
jgi:hypothetical protein